jgi:hypothetical protein
MRRYFQWTFGPWVGEDRFGSAKYRIASRLMIWALLSILVACHQGGKDTVPSGTSILTSVSPGSGAQGTTFSVTFTGSNLTGDNSTTNSSVPVTVNGITTATGVSANNFNACAVLSNGTAECWGPNTNGELGNGTTTSSLVPVPVTGITNVTQISTGFGFACATLMGGSVECWGINTDGQLGNNSTTGSLIPVRVSGF